MKMNPVFLCIASILLMSSGGLNIGNVGLFANQGDKIPVIILGCFFVFLGAVGIGFSFWFHIKAESILFKTDFDNDVRYYQIPTLDDYIAQEFDQAKEKA